METILHWLFPKTNSTKPNTDSREKIQFYFDESVWKVFPEFNNNNNLLIAMGYKKQITRFCLRFVNISKNNYQCN